MSNSYIFDEYDFAEQAVQTSTLGKKPMRTVELVAKYYYANHYSKKEIRNLLDSFLLKCDRNIILPNWAGKLDSVVRRVDKEPLVKIDHITVTVPEIERLSTIQSAQQRRIAFTLLCMAKFEDMARPGNNHWVRAEDKDIFKRANVTSTTRRRQAYLFRALIEAGIIEKARRVDNTSLRVLFTEDGETAMEITDFRNLGYQYLKYCGEPLATCVNCGLVFKPQGVGRPPKHCPECAAEIDLKLRVESVIKGRKSAKNVVVE